MSGPTGAAASIGRRLCDRAIRHHGRCTWVTSRLTSGGRRVEWHPAEADVYDGTAGIALFLAEVADAEGDARLASTAVEAARHAVAGADRMPPERALGFHEGVTGVAVAAARVGGLLGHEELIEASARLAASAMSRRGGVSATELSSGRAGGVAAMLALARMDDARTSAAADAADLAREVADEWRPGPTGLAHGASGVGWALAEAAAATGDARLADAGRAAFADEAGLFDPDVGNWPDLRDRSGRSFRCGWCHGAPGIALARARAWEVLGDEELRVQAEAGIATTITVTAALAGAEGGDYTLCHGAAGNGWALLDAERALGESSDGTALALELAHAGTDRYEARGRAWPTATPADEAPGLMTGVAGIGLFLLRVAGRPMPSVLLPTPAGFAAPAPTR
jgi:lantibiotic modifying enzyme